MWKPYWKKLPCPRVMGMKWSVVEEVICAKCSPFQCTVTNLSVSYEAWCWILLKRKAYSFTVLRNIKIILWVEVFLGMVCFLIHEVFECWLLRTSWLSLVLSRLHLFCVDEKQHEPRYASLLLSLLDCVIKVWRASGTLILISFETFNKGNLNVVKYDRSSSSTKMCSYFVVTFSRDSEIAILLWSSQATSNKRWSVGF